MADVRCPICGKSNPADTETCRYCGARLKPLTNSTDSSSQGETTSSKAQKTDADWLGSLRGQQDVPASASNQGVFVPGPLSQSSTGKGEPENSLNTPDEDFSSWLSRIGAEESLGENSDAPVEKTPGAPTSGGTDDWLASLREIPAGRDPEKNDLYPSGLNGQGNQDDSSWMNRLEPVSHESSSDSGFNFSIPEEPVAPSDEDLPAWLKELSGSAKPTQSQTPAISPAPQAPLPDWFDNLVTAHPDEAGKIETQDRSQSPASIGATLPAESDQPSVESAKTPEMPGWESQEPDWFSGLALPQTANESPAQAEIGSPWDGPLPDWLSSAQTTTVKTGADSGDKQKPGGEKAQLSESALDSGVPDWVSNAVTGLDLPAETKPEEELAWRTELPDWLSGIAAIEPSVQSAQPSNESSRGSYNVVPTGKDSEAESPVGMGELPDWMSNLGPQAAPNPNEGSQTPALLYDESPIVGEQAEVRPFITEEIPDWLVHLGPPEVISSVTLPAEPGAENPPPGQLVKKSDDDSGIVPADIPSWVRAMRPIETATPSVKSSLETDERVENSGPLAGVRGILPAEPLWAEIRKPAAYSVKLQVSEKQRAHAALLQALLSVETEPQKIVRTRPFPSQRIFRLIVALVMIVAVWLPIWIGGPLTPQPAFPVSGINTVKQSIGAIPANAPILVAVEYEPGLSGELETISAGVVAQLMAKSANIVFVSTNPTGPVLAQNLLKRAQALQPSYSSIDKVADLGYLAGGPAALFDFSLAVQNVDPLKTGRPPAWNNPPLNSVKTLADFSRVFVLTDNADTARAWVEQVKPSLRQTPLLMVVSAQSAPMISPYLDSGQISGIITGLTDGASFEQATSQSTSIRMFWDSYQAGLFVMVALILIGGLISIWNMMRANRRPRGEA
jgi:hypothetical protein